MEPAGATSSSVFPLLWRLTASHVDSARLSLAVPREESELFPGFKQAQIVANLCVLGAASAREEEWILQSNKNTGGSINPAPLVRPDSPPPPPPLPPPDVSRCLAQVMLITYPCIFSPPLFVSLYQHLVFGVAGGEKNSILSKPKVPNSLSARAINLAATTALALRAHIHMC